MSARACPAGAGVTSAPLTARARRATSFIFLVCGTATSSWAPMVPFAKTRLGLDEAALGLVLLALGGGSIAAMPLAGLAVHCWGSRPIAVAASLAACAAMPALAVAPSPLSLAAGLFVFGAALGAMDVAMNAQALGVQRSAGRPIMSRFHALFSIGGLIGAGLVTVLLRAGLTLFAAAAAIGAALAGVVLWYGRQFLADSGRAEGSTFALVPSPHVLLLGGLCFVSFLAEGAVLDWSAVLLREVRQVPLETAGLGYALFSVAMAAGRLSGDRIGSRIGAARLLQAGGALAAVGFLAVATLPWPGFTLLGLAVAGLGAANIVPVLFTGAGRAPGVPPAVALATVTTIAYAGLLAGPPLIGFVAHATSLPAAFVLVAAMLALVPMGANIVVNRR